MAILGVQIVITMVVASVMSKVGPYLSFAKWLLTSSNLVRYMHPTDEELRQVAAVPKVDTRKKYARKKGTLTKDATNGVFSVPRNLNIQLDTAKVTTTDIVQLRFYTEYQWLLDFAVYALFVYFLTEVYITVFPAKAAAEVNLSMLWCGLAVGFAYKILASLTGLYFEGEESTGERSLVIVMGLAYLLFAMMVLVVQEDTLETGLDEAYASFNRSAAAFLAENAGLDSSGPASKLVLKFFIALWCGSVGALFTFPGLRMAKMHWDALRYTNSGSVMVLLHATFISPLLISILWIKPISRDYLTAYIFNGMSSPIMTEQQFESARLYLIVFALFFRLVMMPKYLQSYLNLAYHKLEEMKSEAGKISNIDLQKLVARVFYYLCVVALQYVCPMVLILYLTLMYKTMADESWSGLWWSQNNASHTTPLFPHEPVLFAQASEEKTVDAIAGQFSLAWQSLKHVFTTSVFKGLLGFSTWWCCLTWFTSAAIGITYQSYFATV